MYHPLPDLGLSVTDDFCSGTSSSSLCWVLDRQSFVVGKSFCRKQWSCHLSLFAIADKVARVFSFVLYDGGTALLFWGFIAIGLGMMLVYASLAEMASM